MPRRRRIGTGRQRIEDRHARPREITAPLLRGRQSQHRVAGTLGPVAFAADKEKRTVVTDRSTERSSEQVIRRFGRLQPGLLREEQLSLRAVRTVLVDAAPAPSIGAGPGGDVEHATGRAPDLRVVGPELDAHFFHRLHPGNDGGAILDVDDRHAVDHIGVGAPRAAGHRDQRRV